MTNSIERFASKGKYCDYYWSVKKTKGGFVWTIKSDWRKGAEMLQSSLLNNEPGFEFFDTYTAARSDVYEAIQDYYN